MDLIQNISSMAEKVAGSHGLDLVDVELFRAGRRRILRVYIGKRGGVGVEDCAKVSRDLGVLLDAENVMEDDSYTLEVSSPGLDRPFKTLQDFRRNVGRFVRISTREPVEGKKLLVGKLEDADEASVKLDADGKPRSIPMDLIVQAKVDIRIS
ncbi:MAG TPA: ribosome maturation factor RimP [Fibrobacteria bacterium]|nr:ribosome maturation factor RimP [Fibrobacteria bacterium]